MKKINQDTLNTIEKQLFNRALDLDVAIHGVIFSNLPAEILVDAISMYQNKDGGFGNSLILDNYTTFSSPVVTLEALKIFELVGLDYTCEYDVFKSMLKKIFNYLYNKCELISGKWPFAIKENDKFATSSIYKLDTNKEVNLHPTIDILAYTLYFNDENSVFYKKAIVMLKNIVNIFLNEEDVTKQEIIGFTNLIEIINKKNINFDLLDELVMKVEDVTLCKVCKEKELFSNESELLPVEVYNSYTESAQINKLIDDNLDYLIETIKPHGLWDKTMNWNNDYPEQDSAALKWIGRISVLNLILLKKFERIEE